MRYDLDLSDAKEYVPVPAGEYKCIVTEVKWKESQASFEPMLTWELTVVEGEYQQRKLFYNVSLQPQASGFVKGALIAALGSEYSDHINLMTDDTTMLVVQPRLVDRMVIAVLKPQIYNGQTTIKVSFLKSVDQKQTETKATNSNTRSFT